MSVQQVHVHGLGVLGVLHRHLSGWTGTPVWLNVSSIASSACMLLRVASS